MRDIKAVIFDKDGTLFDFQKTWSVWADGVLAELSGGDDTGRADLARLIGYDLVAGAFRPDSIVIAETPQVIAETIIDGLSHAHTPAGVVEVLNRHANVARQVPAVDLDEFFTRLTRQGIAVGLATNDSEAAAHAHLSAVGVAGYFDFVAGYDSGHGAKPQAGQLLAFSAKVGVPSAQTAMVGDSTHDLSAARAAGMAAVGVLTGTASRADLSPLADVVLPDIGHLHGWLGDS